MCFSDYLRHAVDKRKIQWVADDGNTAGHSIADRELTLRCYIFHSDALQF